MEFRLTYDGPLYSSRSSGGNRSRALHIHSIRKRFHKQLATLKIKHPVLIGINPDSWMITKLSSNGFNWMPLVTKRSGLMCRLDILLLRDSEPGHVLADIDNRLKTVFDALRMADTPDELGARSIDGPVRPDADEDPFFTLLEDDRLITHVAVTTDTLLEPVEDCSVDHAVRMIIGVSIRPYNVHMGNLDFI